MPGSRCFAKPLCWKRLTREQIFSESWSWERQRASALTLISVLRWGVNINPVLPRLSGLQLALITADQPGEVVCPTWAALAQTVLGVFPHWRLFLAAQEISSYCCPHICYLLLNITKLPQWAFSFSLCWCHLSLCLFSLSNVFSSFSLFFLLPPWHLIPKPCGCKAPNAHVATFPELSQEAWKPGFVWSQKHNTLLLLPPKSSLLVAHRAAAWLNPRLIRLWDFIVSL